MLKRIALVLVALLVLVVGAAAVALIRAHRAIDRETPPLPTLESIAAVAGVATIVDDPPVQLSVINTASQAMPRRAVLDTARDPHPDEPYVMSYPAFVLRWRDGRMLLIDAGMSRAAAVSFGKPIEWLGGAEAIVPHASIGEALGDATAQVRAIISPISTPITSRASPSCARECTRSGRRSTSPRRSARTTRRSRGSMRCTTPTVSVSSASATVHWCPWSAFPASS